MNISIVNEQDEIIGSKPRDDRGPKDIIRVSGLLVFNSKNETLIAQRAFNKKSNPGKWGPAVAGTVEEGETYISNIIKEAEEEIGLIVEEKDLKQEFHALHETSHRHFVTMYSVIADKSIEEFTKQEDEVVEIKWIAAPDLIKWLEEKPDDFVPSFVGKTIDVIKARF